MSFSSKQEVRNKHGIKYDFSSYVSPLGLPDSFVRSISDINVFSSMPDYSCLDLRKKISSFERTHYENIICGNSISELVFKAVMALRPRKALICAPTDPDFKQILLDNGCDVAEFMLSPENNFALTTEFADHIDEETDMVIVSSPNYPTGELITPYTLGIISERCREHNTIMICDERYLQLVRNSDKYSAKNCVGPHIVVLRSITDTYGVLGFGLSYAIYSAEQIADIVSKAGTIIQIPTLAQIGGIAAIDEEAYLKRSIRVINDERKYLSEELTRIGILVYSSHANFLLFKCELPLDNLLAKRGIIIRNFENVSGLGKGFFGVCVSKRPLNDRIVSEIERLLRVREYIL